MGVKVEHGRIDKNAPGLLLPVSAQVRHNRVEKEAKGLRRGGPIKAKSKHRADDHEDQFGTSEHIEWVGGLPCFECYRHLYTVGEELRPVLVPTRPKISQLSHVYHTRGAGGKVWHILPHCLKHHREYDGGSQSFCDKRGITLEDLRVAAEWLYDVRPPHAGTEGAS